MKAQAASEFLVIIAVLTFLMAPFLLIVYMNSVTAPEKIAIGKAAFSASRLASSANSAGSMGAGARMYSNIEVPDVEGIVASGNEIAITVKTSYGNVVIVQPTHYPVQGVGLEKIRVGGVYSLDIIGPAYNSASPPSVKIVLH